MARVKTGRWSGEPILLPWRRFASWRSIGRIVEMGRFAEPYAVQDRRRRNLDDGPRARDTRAIGRPGVRSSRRSGDTVSLMQAAERLGICSRRTSASTGCGRSGANSVGKGSRLPDAPSRV